MLKLTSYITNLIAINDLRTNDNLARKGRGFSH